ncbi:MAG: hypothetical protein ABIV94_01560 [Acidimicrobiales bacterium]
MTRRLVLVIATAASVAALLGLGRGELAAPPLGSPTELSAWVAARGAVVAAFALVRLGALVLGAYLLATAALGLLAQRFGRTRLADAVDRCTVPTWRAALGGAGLSTITLLAGATVIPTAAGAVDAPTDRLVEIVAPTTTEAVDAEGPPPTMHVLDSPAPTTVPPTPDAPPPDAPPAVAPPGATSSAAPDATWTIEAGESFWSVARDHLAESWNRVPDDHEVDGYWRQLIAANLDVLPTPDPNLLYCGTTLVLPAVD